LGRNGSYDRLLLPDTGAQGVSSRHLTIWIRVHALTPTLVPPPRVYMSWKSMPCRRRAWQRSVLFVGPSPSRGHATVWRAAPSPANDSRCGQSAAVHANKRRTDDDPEGSHEPSDAWSVLAARLMTVAPPAVHFSPAAAVEPESPHQFRAKS